MDGLLHSFPSRVRLRAALVGLVAASALVAGCLETSPREGVFACTEATVASDCPSGWSCVGGLCYREARDAGATDASTDAARPDGAPFDAPTLEDAPTLDGAPMPEDALEPLDAASLDASGPDAAVTCTTSDECDDGVECTIDACTGETCSHTPGTCPTSADHMVGTCTASGCEYACEANYHDLNGLPADGCEYACTWSSAVDRPDDLATDENCDGADGIVGTTIYVKPTGLATGDGTSPATAVNLARAVDLLSSGTAPATVLLAIGDYSVSSPIHPTRPFELYGGYYTADFRHRNANPLVGTPTRIVADAPRALEVVMVDGAVDGLILLTRNRTMAGESAVTVWVANSTSFLVRNAMIQGGRGGPGAEGGAGAAGAAGVAGTPPGRTGLCGTTAFRGDGPAGGTGGGAGSYRGGDGGRAGPDYAGGSYSGANGQVGAARSCSSSSGGTGGSGGERSSGYATAGSAGGPGCAGSNGAPLGVGGVASTGSLTAAGWVAPSTLGGGDGARGQEGSGGGGGGGGGAAKLKFSLAPTEYCTGGGGGGGGGGGTGGDAGRGGGGGGASIAIAAMASTIRIRGTVTLETTGGGAGGRGGDGGAGGSGGAGGAGAPAGSASGGSGGGGNGGVGGRGGDGGRGACGGGGAGGPSVGILTSGGSVDSDGATLDIGVGAGGAAGAACAAGGGNAGQAGVSAPRVPPAP